MRFLDVITKSERKLNAVSFIFSIFYAFPFVFDWNCALAVLGYARQQQSRTFGRLCRFLAQFCFDFRRVHIAAPTGCNAVSLIFSIFCAFPFVFDWNCAPAILVYARGQQSREFGRLCRFLAQFSFDFRRVHIVGPTECVS
ncbi:hypothetical protein V1478_012232 [Vespula squamosa]|uniref:Uncharacterized protein n=1 Tax=Vespula squamosa TaxID=30214 RepID=A0ABD2AD84_VESSQ